MEIKVPKFCEAGPKLLNEAVTVVSIIRLFLLFSIFLTIAPTEAQEPINLFNPKEGQELHLISSPWIPDPETASDCFEDICITGKNGNSTSYDYSAVCLVSPESSPAPECGGDPHDMFWENGVLYAPELLATGRIDTNGIFQNPLSLSDSGEVGSRSYGYVLNHRVEGATFDTLLISCIYQSPLSGSYCASCDWVSTNGYLIGSGSAGICGPGAWKRYYEDPEVFDSIVQITPVVQKKRKIDLYFKRPEENSYNIKGQSGQRRYLHEVPLMKSP